MSELILNQENFDEVVLSSDRPVLVDFWAPWCGPCRIMAPVVSELAEGTKEILVGKVNVDENASLAQRFNILSIPMFIVFKNGVVVHQFSGSMSKDALLDHVKKYFE